jgi:inhibitor of KinA
MLGLQPLGDQGVLATPADEDAAVRLASAVRRHCPPWLLDVVQAYRTVAVFYDLEAIRFDAVADWLRQLEAAHEEAEPGRTHRIPCCYALGPDLAAVAAHCRLTPEEVIGLHSGTEYAVYAIGFCPGFPYLGYLPEALCGVPRRASPRLRVEAGSIGLTGRQTGIYTEERPGGWSLIGRTPLDLVDVAAGYFPLRTGDRVRFEPIDEAEYGRLRGQRLEMT